MSAAASSFRILLVLGMTVSGLRAQATAPWKSSLYDETWSPLPAKSFDSDKLVQDFSYAGYHRGERPLPEVAGPVFDAVADFGADPAGITDSTAEIQAAIDAAAAAGGGVVFLPAGTFRIAPSGGSSFALRITNSDIVLRGAGVGRTFLLGTSTEMRSKRLIEVTGPSPYWTWNSGTVIPITEDLPGPAMSIPVADTAPFTVGDWIVIRTDTTEDWINEHNEPGWLGYEANLGGLRYSRQVTSIDAENGTLGIDAPTRYAIKTRDNARVYLRNNALAEVGLEDFSIGNVEHPGSNWGESDYTDPAKSAYDTHASYLISWRNIRNSWIRRVNTFAHAGNQSGAHLLSNGILLTECRGVTIEGCHFQRPQYGGGGGNGYMYRLGNSNECLIVDSIAEFCRHGFVFSHMGSSGNVFRNCLDKTTGKATGSTGSYNTSGKSSDHHMHFSHSNLIDACTGDGSWFQAAYRPYGTAPLHNLTAAHTVFWNTRCLSSPDGVAVHSQQARYGYVIGTRGNVTAVRTSGHSSAKTDPVDHVEGLGDGDRLDPFSLSLDQRRRRLNLPSLDAGPDREVFFPDSGTRLESSVRFGNSPSIPPGAFVHWIQTSGPATALIQDAGVANPWISFPRFGIYTFEGIARGEQDFVGDDFESRDAVTVTVHPANVLRVELAPTDDAYVRGGAANENDNAGTANQLWMKMVNNLDYERESFLRFDLAPLAGQEIREASLVLHALDPDTNATGVIDLVANDAWNEETVTWANRPTAGIRVDQWSPSPDFRQVLDLTGEVAQEAAGDGAISLRLAIESQSNSATIFKFASKEYPDPDRRPRLSVVVAVSAPEFADWIAGFPGLTPDQTGVDDDPEGDLVVNLGEFFHDADPTRFTPESVVSVGSDAEGRYLEFFLRERVPATARVWVEFSPDMVEGTWTPLSGVRMETVALANGRRQVRAHLPEPPPGVRQGFYRLRFSR